MKIAVCAPTFGVPDSFVHPTNIYALAHELGGLTPFTGGTSPHDRSRGLLQSRAMQTDADAFFWIDSDIKATLEQCWGLVASFEVADANTMTGIYVCRHAVLRGEVALNFNPRPPTGEAPLDIPFGAEGGIYPVTSHGFGFCLVRRRALDAMIAPKCRYEELEAKAWFLPMVARLEHLGEDRSFCYRLHESTRWDETDSGMFVDSRICVEHGGWRVT